MTGKPGFFLSPVNSFFEMEKIIERGELPEYTFIEKLASCVPIIGIFVHEFLDPKINIIAKVDSIKPKNIEAIVEVVKLESRFLKNKAQFNVIAGCISILMIFLLSDMIFPAAVIMHGYHIYKDLSKASLIDKHILEMRLNKAIPKNLLSDLKNC